MTALALQARYDLRRYELFAGRDTAAVTVEAGACLPDGKLSAHRLVQVVGRNLLISRCNGETVGARKVAHEAFVVVAVFLKHPRLRVLTEYPVDREGEAARPIGDRVG